MKNLSGVTVAVCLGIALAVLVAMPNLQAQVNLPPNLGTDPGPQQLPPIAVNTVTCSNNNPNHLIDAPASNPHNQPVGDIPIPLQNLSQNQLDLFCAAVGRFQEINSVAGVLPPSGAGNGSSNCIPADLPPGSTGTIPCIENSAGLGPRFNGNSCQMCHFNPTFLGASGPINPEAAAVTELSIPTGGVGLLDGATNSLSAFTNAPYQINGTTAIREVRFINVPNTTNTDGNVHELFTITGRVDATNAININPALGLTTCAEQQPNFTDAVNQGNVIFRIPIVTQGDGLVELIDDEALELNNQALAGTNGVSGMFNRSGNDATITRFGWKAQNKSMAIFAGEAYNVEQGVTNDLFPNERRIDDDLLHESVTQIEDCQFHALPDDLINFVAGSSNSNQGNLASQISTDVFNFSAAMRLSAPPPHATLNSNEQTGQTLFNTTLHCNQCHANNSTGYLVTTAGSSFPVGQSLQPVLAFSDFAVHAMASGPNLTNTYNQPCLDDQVMQGFAAGNMFRTAPLWGTATRQFFLHDGRTSNLADAIVNHICPGSEANDAGNAFVGLSTTDQDDVLEYLRTL
ncbi:MAG: di-heme oxidoredictase family protein [Candidatus Sulfotelmatobacter sp.]